MAYGHEKHRSPRNVTLIMDWVHIVLGFLIVLIAVVAFLNPEGNMMLFPLVFFLASLLNLLNGGYRFRQSGRDNKKKALGVGQLVIAVLLFATAIISGVSIWG